MSRILKWQGGKSGIMNIISSNFPEELFKSTSDITFIDVFSGGGSVFEYVLKNCSGITRLLINDINYNLVNVYRIVKEYPKELIKILTDYENDFHNSNDKVRYYNEIKNNYNHLVEDCIIKAAEFIFLNKTGFNGIYRENSFGIYNVPANDKVKRGENIDIVDINAINDLSNLLNNSKVEIQFYHGDFSQVEPFVTINNTFLYLDPPYRPLSGSSSFTSYSQTPFNDSTQKRLKNFCDYLKNNYNAKIMQSNSYDPNDKFLLNLYKDYRIIQINATRSSGGKGAMRGTIKENLIMNY